MRLGCGFLLDNVHILVFALHVVAFAHDAFHCFGIGVKAVVQLVGVFERVAVGLYLLFQVGCIPST